MTATSDSNSVNHSGRPKDMKPPEQDSKKTHGPPTGPPPSFNEQQSFAPGPSMQAYHYVNPQTGHQISTPFPPDHPEMICLQQGGHVTHTKFGILGECFELRTYMSVVY